MSLVPIQQLLFQGYQEENESAEARIKRLEAALKRQGEVRAGEVMNMEREIMRASEQNHERNADAARQLRCARASPW